MQEKLGSGHAAAWLRAGGKEAAQVLVAFPNHAIQPVEEPGLVGTATQLEVNQEKGNSLTYEQTLQARARPALEKRSPQMDQTREL